MWPGRHGELQEGVAPDHAEVDPVGERRAARRASRDRKSVGRAGSAPAARRPCRHEQRPPTTGDDATRRRTRSAAARGRYRRTAGHRRFPSDRGRPGPRARRRGPSAAARGDRRRRHGQAGPVDDLTRTALAARDGDRAALARFVRESQADVWRLAAHLVDRGAADDLTQEVYERALRGLARVPGRVVGPDLAAVDRPPHLRRHDPPPHPHAHPGGPPPGPGGRPRPRTPTGHDVELDELLGGARPGPARGLRAHPAPGLRLRRGRRGVRVPGGHHPLPRGPGPGRPGGPRGSTTSDRTTRRG